MLKDEDAFRSEPATGERRVEPKPKLTRQVIDLFLWPSMPFGKLSENTLEAADACFCGGEAIVQGFVVAIGDRHEITNHLTRGDAFGLCGHSWPLSAGRVRYTTPPYLFLSLTHDSPPFAAKGSGPMVFPQLLND